jgi:hypothetical protein
LDKSPKLGIGDDRSKKEKDPFITGYMDLSIEGDKRYIAEPFTNEVQL